MEKQKKIALINDLTGFGRCSTAVMAPIVSAMKIQAVAVPTAILSAHTQFPTYYFDEDVYKRQVIHRFSGVRSMI